MTGAPPLRSSESPTRTPSPWRGKTLSGTTSQPVTLTPPYKHVVAEGNQRFREATRYLARQINDRGQRVSDNSMTAKSRRQHPANVAYDGRAVGEYPIEEEVTTQCYRVRKKKRKRVTRKEKDERESKPKSERV